MGLIRARILTVAVIIIASAIAVIEVDASEVTIGLGKPLWPRTECGFIGTKFLNTLPFDPALPIKAEIPLRAIAELVQLLRTHRVLLRTSAVTLGVIPTQPETLSKRIALLCVAHLIFACWTAETVITDTEAFGTDSVCAGHALTRQIDRICANDRLRAVYTGIAQGLVLRRRGGQSLLTQCVSADNPRQHHSKVRHSLPRPEGHTAFIDL